MTGTNIVMDEDGEMFVPWKDGSGEEEMSVDGPPQQSEESTENDSDETPGLESPSENNILSDAVILVENALQRCTPSKDTGQVKGCPQDKTQESPCNLVTEQQSPDTARDEIQLTEDSDGDSLSIAKPSEDPLVEDTRKLSTKLHAESVDSADTHFDFTAEVCTQQIEYTSTPAENDQSLGHPVSPTSNNEEDLPSNLHVLSKQTKTEDEPHRCVQDAVAADPIGADVCSEDICSKVKEEKGGMDILSGVSSSESKPSKEHTGIEGRNESSAVIDDTLKSHTKSSPEEMKPQKEKASPIHFEKAQTQTVSNVSPSSPQRKSSVIFQRTTSGANIQAESEDASTDKDQLYPLRKMQEEKDMERLTHTQGMDLHISESGQYKDTERSIEKPNEERSGTPNLKKVEAKAEITHQHQVVQMDISEPKQPVIQKDVPLEEFKSHAEQLCPEEKNVKETIQPHQVNTVCATPENMKTPPSNTGVKTQLQSPEETTSVPREQVLTEAQIEKDIDLAKTDNTAHQQMLQVGRSMEGRPSVMHNDTPSESITEATHLYPEDSFVMEVLKQVSATMSPEDKKSLYATGVVSQPQIPENKADVPREVALTGPQIEKTDENSLEASVNIAAESREPYKHGNAEAFTETQPHQANNNSALEVNYKVNDVNYKVNDADDLVDKTIHRDPQGTFPKDVLQEQDQNTQPREQPFYSEPPSVLEHLYVEPEEIQLIEDPYVREQVGRLEHVTLNIAVTGMTGAGKSTFINAIRGIDNDNEKAAPTGVTETSMDVCAYPHPSMPNVNLWDLPGTGSPKFKAKKYLKDVKFETYDFFIIISSERFKENDMMLAIEILKKNKKFYFLRSKIDNELRAEQHKKTYNEQKLLDSIREDCINHLKKVIQPTVFLICSFELDRYDFPPLVDTLLRDLPEHKKDALTLSLPIYSTQVLERKIKTLTKTAQSAAKAAAGISVAPIPGLAMACDAGILLGFFSKCYYAFGLDDKSLDKLSERVNNHSLKAIRETRPLVMAVRKKELSGRELSELGSKRAALEFAYSLVPVWGSKRAASMSRTATLNLLSEGLKEFADTARDVLKAAKIDHI